MPLSRYQQVSEKPGAGVTWSERSVRIQRAKEAKDKRRNLFERPKGASYEAARSRLSSFKYRGR